MQTSRIHGWAELRNCATDARIFLFDGRPFTDPEVEAIVGRLRAFVPGTIKRGRWTAGLGDDYERVVVREYEPSG